MLFILRILYPYIQVYCLFFHSLFFIPARMVFQIHLRSATIYSFTFVYVHSSLE
ncbi:6 kDa protein [Grapevine leafroll-associated virus 13]|uniref:6 kDa protein n=1 Tax=Grapevine leafroll-associated virus 13 TaxID=1815581 RepID=A0A160NTL8_9CLOS|nr:6 kDa protein [Grapevine leafroll-associated virus 13]BAU80809.1 6 kDa protein [Grapevine leafroll-associated virus 13]BDX29248.1 6kDa-protein [Grapevine leafroll-associated virus 13]